MMLLTEAAAGPDRGVVFAFGRFQPPHRGHCILANFVIQAAAKLNADAVIFGSTSQDPKKNPLPWKLKMQLFQQLMGRTPLHFEMTPGITNPAIAVGHLVELGYTRIYLVAAGDDRMPGFQKMMQSIKRSPLGQRIKDLQVISSDVPGAARVKGISGTAAREAAIAGNLEAFTYVVGPQNPKAAEQIYHQLRNFMGIRESAVEWIARRWHTELLREASQQERDPTATPAVIAKRLANYAAQEAESTRLLKIGRDSGDKELERGAKSELQQLRKSNPRFTGPRYTLKTRDGRTFHLNGDEREEAMSMARSESGVLYDNVEGRNVTVLPRGY